MCDKLRYENPRIDRCLVEAIEQINAGGEFHTIASCCGHGRYPPTIIVRDRNGHYYEYVSKQLVDKAKRHRYYRRDPFGFYYVGQIDLQKCHWLDENNICCHPNADPPFSQKCPEIPHLPNECSKYSATGMNVDFELIAVPGTEEDLDGDD
nr:hypothetical protein [Candidatus Sigynarchaeota archaeon]